MGKKRVELERNTAENANAVKQRQEAKEAFATAQKKFQTESAGLARNEDGEDATLNDQLIGELYFLLVAVFNMFVENDPVCVAFRSMHK